MTYYLSPDHRGPAAWRRWVRATVLAACALALASPAWAGTLCGVVRDALSGDPIARAGVFVRHTDWTYTGLSAATDAEGRWCLDGIPAGTYHLDVRRDGYRIGIARDVVVTDATSDVQIGAEPPRLPLDAPWPNPAAGQVSFRLRLDRDGPATLSVHDVAGRLVRSWADDGAVAGERSFTWDFRDEQGRVLPSGRYYLRLEADGVVTTRPFAHVR